MKKAELDRLISLDETAQQKTSNLASYVAQAAFDLQQENPNAIQDAWLESAIIEKRENRTMTTLELRLYAIVVSQAKGFERLKKIANELKGIDKEDMSRAERKILDILG